jgi:hypothetical protein
MEGISVVPCFRDGCPREPRDQDRHFRLNISKYIYDEWERETIHQVLGPNANVNVINDQVQTDIVVTALTLIVEVGKIEKAIGNWYSDIYVLAGFMSRDRNY